MKTTENIQKANNAELERKGFRSTTSSHPEKEQLLEDGKLPPLMTGVRPKPQTVDQVRRE